MSVVRMSSLSSGRSISSRHKCSRPITNISPGIYCKIYADELLDLAQSCTFEYLLRSLRKITEKEN